MTFSLQIVCYIYFTRIIAILLKVGLPFQWLWCYEVRKPSGFALFLPSFPLILPFFPRSSVSGRAVHPHLLRVDGIQVQTCVQQPLPAAAPGRGGRGDGRSVSRSRPLGPEVSGLWSSEFSLFLQRDRVRSAGGNFQSEEDVQRTRAPERVHLVSRNVRLCWRGGGVSSGCPQSSLRGCAWTEALRLQSPVCFFYSSPGCSGPAH